MSKQCSLIWIDVKPTGKIVVTDTCSGEVCVFDGIQGYTDTDITFTGDKIGCYKFKDIQSPKCPDTIELFNKVCDAQEDAIAGGFPSNPDGKIPMQPIKCTDYTDRKNPKTFFVYPFNLNGIICWTKDPEGTDLITNIEEFMASLSLGGLPVIKNDLSTKKGAPLDVCGGADGRTVTLADLATRTDAEIAALTTKIPPEDGYEWAVLGFEVNQHPAKKKLYCDLADEEGVVAANDQYSYAFNGDSKQYGTIGDSPDTIVKPVPDADACGCLDDRTCLATDADFTQPLTLEPDTGVEICPIYVCVVTA